MQRSLVEAGEVEDCDVDEFVAAVLARLTDRTGEIVDAVCEAVLREVPAYTWAQGNEPEDFRSAVRRTVGLYLRVLEERRRLLDEELVALHVIGAQRARQALPAESVGESLRVSLREWWQHVLAAAGELPASDVAVRGVGAMAAHLFEFGHDVAVALDQGYRTEQEQRLTGRVRAQASFVDRLLEGHWDDDAEIRSQARALGHDLGASCGLLLVLPAAGQDAERLRAGAGALADRLPTVVEGPMRVLPLPHVLLLFPSASPKAWGNDVDVVARVAAGERLLVVPLDPVVEVASLAHVYRRAHRYLPLTTGLRPRAGVVTVKELRLRGVLDGIPAADRVAFARDMLGPVLDLPTHKARELLDTLEAVYRRKGRIAEAAADLHLHRNSVRYRLGRIEELTGLSLDVPADRLHLEIAMRLRGDATAELARLDDPSGARPVGRTADGAQGSRPA